jgi:AhpD family alkylhydroperoxidase
LSLIEEYNKRREQGNQNISDQDFLPFNRFMSLDSRAYDEGAIPTKYKELMGLSGSMVLRCNDCITYHIIKSTEAGCSREEILEALNIGLVIGGSVVIPHLRYALAVLDEISGK